MAVTALIKFTQAATVYTAGQAAIGVASTLVTVANNDNTNVVLWTYTFIDTPPNSSIPVGVAQSGPLATYSFTPDAPGSYLIKLTVNDSGAGSASDTRTFGVRNSKGRLPPAYLAQGFMVNFSGQARGWAPENEQYFAHIDNNVINVKDNLALGTDSGNDSSAFNSAILSASYYGGKVYIPAGTYRLTSGLTMLNGVELFGDGIGRTILHATATDCITVTDVSNWKLRDLEIKADSGNGIVIQGSSSIGVKGAVVEDVKISKVGSAGIGVKVAPTSTGIISGIVFRNLIVSGSSPVDVTSVGFKCVSTGSFKDSEFYGGRFENLGTGFDLDNTNGIFAYGIALQNINNSGNGRGIVLRVSASFNEFRGVEVHGTSSVDVFVEFKSGSFGNRFDGSIGSVASTAIIDSGSYSSWNGATGDGSSLINQNGQPETRTARFIVNAPFALSPENVILANGDNNNIGTGLHAYIRISGPSGAYAITGINAGPAIPGQLIKAFVNVSQTLTIKHQNASSVSTNRINTLIGADVQVPPIPSILEFIYDSTGVWLFQGIEEAVPSVENAVSITGSYTIPATIATVFANSSGSVSFTASLPSSPTFGEKHTIKDTGGFASVFNITLNGNGHNIDGSTPKLLNVSYGSIAVSYNGTEWSIV